MRVQSLNGSWEFCAQDSNETSVYQSIFVATKNGFSIHLPIAID
jgi:hypothetical protein